MIKTHWHEPCPAYSMLTAHHVSCAFRLLHLALRVRLCFFCFPLHGARRILSLFSLSFFLALSLHLLLSLFLSCFPFVSLIFLSSCHFLFLSLYAVDFDTSLHSPFLLHIHIFLRLSVCLFVCATVSGLLLCAPLSSALSHTSLRPAEQHRHFCVLYIYFSVWTS